VWPGTMTTCTKRLTAGVSMTGHLTNAHVKARLIFPLKFFQPLMLE
jgi:hypothetical protein